MKRVINLLLPLCGIGMALAVWWAASVAVPDLPSPVRTWDESKLYILEPLAKRGESDQGILLLAYYSLMRVARGFLLGVVIATPLGFLLGVSSTLTRMFDPIMQVLRLSRTTTFTKIIVPATLPYMFTGYRLSLGIAWLVIVASEMLTGTPGVGGFLWQEYNSLVYAHILLAIITIGVVGFALDRLMGMAEARLRASS